MSERPTVVLLPGLDGTGKLFDPLVRVLEPRIRAVVISYPLDRCLDYSELANYVRARLPVGRFLLVAESFSGPVAVALGANKPNGLCGIVLCNSFVAPPAPSWLKALPYEKVFQVGVPSAVLRYLLVGSGHEDVLRELVYAIRSVRAAVLASRVRSVLTWDATQSLQACVAPIACVSSSADRIIRRRGFRAARSIRPEIEEVAIHGPHLVLQTRPHEAAQIIEKYVHRWCGTICDESSTGLDSLKPRQ